jgi:uncharacterized protein YecT (DUF1311 family)
MMLVVALSLSGAEPSNDFDGCMQRAAGVSVKMLQCGHAEIMRWDARLNSAYRKLLQQSSPTQRSALRSEQRRWLSRHIATTKRLASAPDNGSSAFLDSQRFELSDLSERTRRLEDRLAGIR